MNTIQTEGIQIAAEAFGASSDPCLLLVMGATASMLGWPDSLCHRLAEEGLYVIRFDHRDTGGSTTVVPGAAAYAVEDMAQDVIGVMDGFGIERAHLMGMSLGGYLSQMLALTHSDRILSLTLIGSEPLGWDGEALAHIAPAFLAHFSGLADLDWSDRDAVTEFLLESERLCAGSGEPFAADAMRARIATLLSRTTSPASMFNHAALEMREDWTGRFREIRVPVLVIHGEEDPILPLENGKALAEGIAGAELLVLEGTGHELTQRTHDRIARAVGGHVRHR